MGTLSDVIDLGCLTKVHIPVEIRRSFRLGEWSTDITTIDTTGDSLDVSQQPLVNHVHGAKEQISLESLLSPDTEDQIGILLACGSNQKILFQCQRQRLLAEDVFSSLKSLDRDLGMPVIGRHDTDDLDVLPFKNLSIVFVSFCFPLPDIGVFTSPGKMIGVEITNGHDVTKTIVIMGITRSHSAESNTADEWPFIGRFHGHRCSGGCIPSGSGSQSCGGNLQKFSTGSIFLIHALHLDAMSRKKE